MDISSISSKQFFLNPFFLDHLLLINERINLYSTPLLFYFFLCVLEFISYSSRVTSNSSLILPVLLRGEDDYQIHFPLQKTRCINNDDPHIQMSVHKCLPYTGMTCKCIKYLNA
jgi:hypothetical protein